MCSFHSVFLLTLLLNTLKINAFSLEKFQNDPTNVSSNNGKLIFAHVVRKIKVVLFSFSFQLRKLLTTATRSIDMEIVTSTEFFQMIDTAMNLIGREALVN